MARRPLILLAAMLLIEGTLHGAAYDGTTPPALADGDGSLAGLAEDDVSTLRTVRDRLANLAGNTRLSWVMRRDAVAARRRLHEALNDWGRQGQLAFYLDLFLSEPNARVRAGLAHNAMCAAKARQYHFGGVRAFWRKMEALMKETDRELSSHTGRVRSHLTHCERPLRTAADLDLRLKPYRLDVPRLKLESVLRPYKQPKPSKRQ